jgi:GGDEF domain-containing protein
MGMLIRKTLGRRDVGARFGGQEFAVFLADADYGEPLQHHPGLALGALKSVPFSSLVTARGQQRMTIKDLYRHPIVGRPIDRRTVVHWYDFICPFCYLGQARTTIFEDRGFAIVECIGCLSGLEISSRRWAVTKNASQ